LDPERPAEAGVRFTRTPDHVLQARHRRREQAQREKEEALRAAEAEAAARAAAEIAAAEAARAEAEAARAEAEAAAAAAAVPLWRQPYVLPPGVRFTRTPDHLLRHSHEEIARAEAVPEPAETAAADAVPGDGAPLTDSPVAPEVSGTEPVTAEPVPEMVAAVTEPVTEAAAPGISQEAVPAQETGPLTVQAVAEGTAQEMTREVAHDLAESPSPRSETAPAAASGAGVPSAAAPDAVALHVTASESADAVASAATVPPAPDGTASELTVAAQAPAPPPQVFDVPNSAILVPVDVSHLRSLPPRPVYTLDRLLRHDWTRPLPTAAEQDNRPVQESVVEEPVAEPRLAEEAVSSAEPAVAEAPLADRSVANLSLAKLSLADLPPDTPFIGVPLMGLSLPRADFSYSWDFPEAWDFQSMGFPLADVLPETVPPANPPHEPMAETAVEAVMEAVPAGTTLLGEVPEADPVTGRRVASNLPSDAILLPAPAPMLALTYAAVTETVFVPEASEPMVVPLPATVGLEASMPIEMAVDVAPAGAPEFASPPAVSPAVT
ncbi:hypothetical protein VP06_32300, partial [Methylobacterium aquaticum]